MWRSTQDDPSRLVLGNGSRVSGPLYLWIAAGHLGDYRAAVATAIRAGGDVDTTAAIVGGIVALATGAAGIPAEWLAGREGLLV